MTIQYKTRVLFLVRAADVTLVDCGPNLAIIFVVLLPLHCYVSFMVHCIPSINLSC